MAYNHKTIEKNVFIMLVLTFIIASIGAIVEIFPLFIKEIALEKVDGMRQHTPLELAGFRIYKREGCYGCHSQQIRVLRDEVERYGHYSLAVESMHDHPFQWGSKRTGPDLARVGGKYSDKWQVQHLVSPQSVVPDSIMPRYAFLLDREVDLTELKLLLEAHQLVGDPYTDEDIAKFEEDIKIQLAMNTDIDAITDFQKRYPSTFISKFNAKYEGITEMDALVAYLQSLGNRVDLKTNKGRDW